MYSFCQTAHLLSCLFLLPDFFLSCYPCLHFCDFHSEFPFVWTFQIWIAQNIEKKSLKKLSAEEYFMEEWQKSSGRWKTHRVIYAKSCKLALRSREYSPFHSLIWQQLEFLMNKLFKMQILLVFFTCTSCMKGTFKKIESTHLQTCWIYL